MQFADVILLLLANKFMWLMHIYFFLFSLRTHAIFIVLSCETSYQVCFVAMQWTPFPLQVSRDSRLVLEKRYVSTVHIRSFFGLPHCALLFDRLIIGWDGYFLDKEGFLGFSRTVAIFWLKVCVSGSSRNEKSWSFSVIPLLGKFSPLLSTAYVILFSSLVLDIWFR